MQNVAIGLLIPFLGTMLGSALVFFMKDKIMLSCKSYCWDLQQGNGLCCCGRINTRGSRRKSFKYRNNWFCNRFCNNDGFRYCIWMIII